MTANAAQAQAWNGDDGRHFVAERARHERMHERLTSRLLDAAAISAGDSVLDIGCGCGQTTLAAARAAAPGHVLGVDLSAPMLAVARRLAGRDGARNARFEQADAQTRAFPAAGFDVALSSFGVMFFDDPPAAFANIAAALRPGGRVAFLCWQEAARNEFLAVPLAAVAAHAAMPEMPGAGEPGPFSLADPQRIRSLLASAGFADISISGLEEPMRVGDDVQDVIGYYRGLPIARQMLAGAGEQATASVLETLRAALGPHQGDDGVTLGSAAWLVTAQR